MIREEDTWKLPSESAAVLVADGCGTAFETVFVSEDSDAPPPMMALLTGRATDASPVSTTALSGSVVGTETSFD